ncbi:Beta-ketoacyl synthase, N-terminal domain [Rheinheimera pacifica]|uniref:Beta-ketoacyl synthase, N-terminal domain n=2 Tax=Rheinheimera pacifica TaxID=173990 RepID=A0A1H6K3M4_9GAMM|nr:Beta-ketoacyl synthase, N-terminal domain [Rheinheimera pacifica]
MPPSAMTQQDTPDVSLPALTAVPAMTRRRLSKLTKLAFEVALNTVVTGQQISTIFTSRHGDLHKTLGLLQQLAERDDISPSQFALSVHNAISGQFSIFSQNYADSNAIAAGADSLHYALLEAAARFSSEPQLQQLLVVYADEPVPAPYQTFCKDPSIPIALALLLGRDGDKLLFEMQPDAASTASDDHALQLLPLLQGDVTQLSIAGHQRHWLWQRA